MDLQSIPLFKALTRRMAWLNQRQRVLAENIKGPDGNGAPVARETRPSDVEPTPTGNTVVLEKELMKVAQTRLDHEVTASLYRKHVDMLRMVLARR